MVDPCRLRKNSTEAEKILWTRLRSRRIGEKCRRQVSIGPFVVDFCCFSRKLVVELDGQPHKLDDQRRKDVARTKFLEDLGYHIVRFWNAQVINEIDRVLEEIGKNLTHRLHNFDGSG